MYAATSNPCSLARYANWQLVSRPPEYAKTSFGLDGSGLRNSVLLNFCATEEKNLVSRDLETPKPADAARKATARNIFYIIYEYIF
mmetsp:Transcript_18462/g.23511  ORF Transcript_18462/g.23511 Transcript_18462/m.23511 type:complete len:86 (-) Transcript_18462:90-347(-)